MENIISIITSAYNVSKYIEKTIKSCLNQTYKNIELIIINDASTDDTLKIANKYARKYNNIKVYDSPINKGAGCSRKKGIELASGDYITFLDGDDYIKKDYIQALYNAAIKYDADIVRSGLYFVIDKKQKLSTYNKVIIAEDIDSRYSHLAWADNFLNSCLVKKSLFDYTDYSERRICEDTPTLLRLLYYAKKTVRIPYAGYYYIQRNSSITHDKNEFRKFIIRMEAGIETVEFFKDKGEYFNIEQLKQLILELNYYTIDKSEYEEYKERLDNIINYLNNG